MALGADGRIRTAEVESPVALLHVSGQDRDGCPLALSQSFQLPALGRVLVPVWGFLIGRHSVFVQSALLLGALCVYGLRVRLSVWRIGR